MTEFFPKILHNQHRFSIIYPIIKFKSMLQRSIKKAKFITTSICYCRDLWDFFKLKAMIVNENRGDRSDYLEYLENKRKG